MKKILYGDKRSQLHKRSQERVRKTSSKLRQDQRRKIIFKSKEKVLGCFAARLLIALFSIFFKHESNIFLHFFKVSLAINQLSFIIFVKVTICKSFLNLIQEKEASRSIYSSDNTLTMSAKQPYPHPILFHWPLSIPPEDIRKPKVF